jgi:hypothetical protein
MVHPQGMRTGQRRMTAKIYLYRRRKPPQLIVPLPFIGPPYQEGGFWWNVSFNLPL